MDVTEKKSVAKLKNMIII